MRKCWLILFLLCLNHSAHADGADQVCQHLKSQAQKPAEYVPGVDVRGKPVKPADLNETISEEVWEIPITIDLSEKFGLALANGVKLEPEIAKIKIHQNGTVEYQNLNITNQVKATCAGEKLPKPDGQKAADAVVSGDKIEGQYPDKE